MSKYKSNAQKAWKPKQSTELIWKSSWKNFASKKRLQDKSKIKTLSSRDSIANRDSKNSEKRPMKKEGKAKNFSRRSELSSR